MSQIVEVPVTHIDANPDNPRHDLGDLSQLEASIRQVGILQPLVVRRNGTGDTYQLIAGHRRFAAAIRAGLNTIPVVPVEADDRDALAMALIENLQREDIDPIDEAVAYRKLKDFGWKQNDIAKRISRSPSHISKRIRLLDLPEKAQKHIRSGDIPVELAYEVAKAAKEHGIDPDAVVDDLLYVDPEDREGQLDISVENARWRKAREDRYRETEALGFQPLPHKEEYGRHVPDVDASPVGHGWRNTLEFEDNDAHQAEPCARFLVGTDYEYDEDNHTTIRIPVVEWYCIDPGRHTPGGDSDLKVIDRSARRLQEEEKRKEKERARKAEKKARTAWIRSLFDTAAGAQTVDYDLVVARALRVLIHRLEVNVAKLACDYLHLEPERKGEGNYSWSAWRETLEKALDQDLYRTLLAITIAQGESHIYSPHVPEDADWVQAHLDYIEALGYRPEGGDAE